jgi:UDP:flavonoid glycosyltransferase YjiC (YdhE family)
MRNAVKEPPLSAPRILFVSLPWPGHVTPLVAVGRTLTARGCDVAWLTPTDLFWPARPPDERIARAGVTLLPPMAVTHDPRAGEGVSFEAMATNASVLKQFLSRYLEKEVPAEVEQVREVIRRLRPDVVALDGHVPSGVIAAHLEGVPWAQINVALHLLVPQDLQTHELDVLRQIEPQRRALFARHGLDVDLRAHEVVVSPYLNTVFAHPSFAGRDVVLPPKTFLVGAYARDDEPIAFPWERIATDRPLLYFAMGTLLTAARELPRLLATLAEELDVQLVMALRTEEALGKAIVVPWAPQIELLKHAGVFITHGGSNSVLEGLVAGVPMLVLGKHLDLAIQAHFVEKSGAGIALDPDDLGRGRLGSALAALLDPGGAHARRAYELGCLHRPAEGADKVAGLLMELVSFARA